MGQYSKLIGSLLGSIIAIVVTYLAAKGIATCAPGPDGTEACSVFGFTTGQITTAATALVSAALVYFFPANKPPA